MPERFHGLEVVKMKSPVLLDHGLAVKEAGRRREQEDKTEGMDQKD
jgi:hypothetical protein